MTDDDTRSPGRPRRGDEPDLDHRELERLLIHGEWTEGADGVERHRYATYRELAERFGISKSLVGRYAQQHNCVARRRAALEAGKAPTPPADTAASSAHVPRSPPPAPELEQSAGELDGALRGADDGLSVERILRMAERWLDLLEEAIDEGRLKPDLADLERFIRVIKAAKEEGDERAGIPEGMPTLADLERLYAENERRAREETPAMQGRLPHGTIPISWVKANEPQLRAKLAALEAQDGG
ncbi:MAG: hypothetical protein KC619_28015 [Myxococcales bacterium]|nr:hypothetical protein [Myxococcales bacterium]